MMPRSAAVATAFLGGCVATLAGLVALERVNKLLWGDRRR